MPYVGDNVVIDVDKNKHGIIKEVVTRKNFLIRPAVANVDQLVLIVSTYCPKPNFFNIDVLISIAELLNLEVIIIVTKVDLKNDKDIFNVYSKIGYKVFEINNMNLNDFERYEILKYLKNKINVLCGNSGVGKTSFINAFNRALNLKTCETSYKLGRGKHATRNVEMVDIGDCYIVDTPGFSSIKINLYKNIVDVKIDTLFKEFAKYAGKCKFDDCKHVLETGCKIIEAKSDGEIANSRYNSYVKMLNEVDDLKRAFWR
mgnify:CR=1 FL=1